MQSYLTPADLLPCTAALVSQFADWDPVEGTWDVHIPLPPIVTAPTPGPFNVMDLGLQFHDFAEQNGIDYGYVGGGDGTLTAAGLELA